MSKLGLQQINIILSHFSHNSIHLTQPCDFYNIKDQGCLDEAMGEEDEALLLY